MLLKYLNQLRNRMDKHSFLMLMSAVEDDIRFNRVRFNKITTAKEFIDIVERTHKVISRCTAEC